MHILVKREQGGKSRINSIEKGAFSDQRGVVSDGQQLLDRWSGQCGRAICSSRVENFDNATCSLFYVGSIFVVIRMWRYRSHYKCLARLMVIRCVIKHVTKRELAHSLYGNELEHGSNDPLVSRFECSACCRFFGESLRIVTQFI